jgi:hypothetical protein
MCPTSCTTDGDCTTTAYCNSSQCEPRFANGTACTASDECMSNVCSHVCQGTTPLGATCSNNSECVSNVCMDGVCCNNACAGQCEACDVSGSAGTCTAVTGAPHGARTCTGEGTMCGGQCDGTDVAACSYPTTKTACGSTCSKNEETDSTCDGQGGCVQGRAHTCDNFICANSSTCKTSCVSDVDCIVGFACLSGKCQPGGSICIDSQTSKNDTQVDGGVTHCAPYICEDDAGTCLQRCKSVSDCVAPSVCNSNGQCVAPPTANSGSSGGCATARGEASGGGIEGWLFGVALVVARRRRRGATAHASEVGA